MVILRYFIFLSIFFSHLTLIAQNNKVGVGLGGGFIQAYGDVDNSIRIQPVFNMELDCKITKKFNLVTELHFARLVNGNFTIATAKTPIQARYFVTDIQGLSTSFTYRFFKWADDADFWQKTLRSLYVGAGIGADNRKVISVRSLAELKNKMKYAFPSDNGSAIQYSLPVIMGINLHIPNSRLAVGLKGQLSIIPQDELDGYLTDINGLPDFYAVGGINLKYYFSGENRFNSNKGY